MSAVCLMLQGTSSNVGKSILAAGLCRLLSRRGFKVAPFKSQNMALNSYVTRGGGEIGRAQAVQAEAAGVEPAVEMNPILLKPKEDMTSQVIVMGTPLSDMGAAEYRRDYVPSALNVVKEALQRLCFRFEVVIIEGAGSPAEVNLRERDIANMEIALMAGAPVLLVADIDRGGAFASIIGTLELLSPGERNLVSGFLINKFRGDLNLLKDGLEFLEGRTGLPVLGVIPYVRDLGIDEEDSVSLLERRDRVENSGGGEFILEIVVLRLPRISNYTDFAPLEAEPDVNLRYVEHVGDIGNPHAVILPGTKSTTADLEFLYSHGLAGRIKELFADGTVLLGICGGFQMMGEELRDPVLTESDKYKLQQGLGIFPMDITYSSPKIARQVEALISSHSSWGDLAGINLEGYEIRHGVSEIKRQDMPSMDLTGGGNREIIGLATRDMAAVGTYLHDLFHNDVFRRRWLNLLRRRKGLPPLKEENTIDSRKRKEEAYDHLADVLEENIDLDRLYKILGVKGANR